MGDLIEEQPHRREYRKYRKSERRAISAFSGIPPVGENENRGGTYDRLDLVVRKVHRRVEAFPSES
jgi:hypothetical protein